MIPSFYRGMQFYKILFSEYCRVPCRNSLRQCRIRRVRGRNSRCHDPNPRARVSKLGSRKIAKFFRSADYSSKVGLSPGFRRQRQPRSIVQVPAHRSHTEQARRNHGSTMPEQCLLMAGQSTVLR
jgi:hypothetical protein